MIEYFCLKHFTFCEKLFYFNILIYKSFLSDRQISYMISVTPAFREPIPGWVDNLNGPMGVMIGAGKGVIRSMLCSENNRAEVIPVDIAINALIVIAYKRAKDK